MLTRFRHGPRWNISLFGGRAIQGGGSRPPRVTPDAGPYRSFSMARAKWRMTSPPSALSIPAFGLTIAFGPAMIRAFGLAPDVEALAIEYWIPRMIGGPLAAALWAACAFFNGIGRTRITLAIGLVVLGSNTVLNEIFIFRLGWGMSGAAWATTVAELIGVLLAIRMILS